MSALKDGAGPRWAALSWAWAAAGKTNLLAALLGRALLLL